jgi:myo-inositol-1(or 4)-monophosphatase
VGAAAPAAVLVSVEGGAPESLPGAAPASDPESTPKSPLASDPESTPGRLLEVAVGLCETAGALLLERFEGDRQEGVRTKTTPTDLVSEADLASEHAIAARLAELRPQDGILAEEGNDHQSRSGLRWVVDPLDGTVNFLFGIPQWCVSVAVQEEAGRTLAGAIFDPCRQELWTATADGPARLDDAPIEGSSKDDLPTAMIATGFTYAASVRAAQAEVFAKLIPRVRDIRRFGSAALDLAWTAAGRYDAYFERGVNLWDVAAGALICERAGLSVAELPAKGPLPWGMLAAAPALAGPLLEIVG